MLCAGIATSLKVLFHEADCAEGSEPQPPLIMERNEVIALFNLFERLTKSIEIVRKMSLELLDRKNGSPHSVSSRSRLVVVVGRSIHGDRSSDGR